MQRIALLCAVLSLLPAASAAQQPAQLSVLTYNVHGLPSWVVRVARGYALDWIRDNPGRFVALAPRKLAYMWSPIPNVVRTPTTIALQLAT